MLSTIDWLHSAEVFCSCHALFSFVYYVFDFLGVIVIIHAQLSVMRDTNLQISASVSRCLACSSLCCFLAPLGQESTEPRNFWIEKTPLSTECVPSLWSPSPIPIKFCQGVVGSCTTGVPQLIQHSSQGSDLITCLSTSRLQIFRIFSPLPTCQAHKKPCERYPNPPTSNMDPGHPIYGASHKVCIFLQNALVSFLTTLPSPTTAPNPTPACSCSKSMCSVL